ncbi:Uroporphyrinogen decarboxylase, chloroplast precursor [Ectocarpus siliculosus]|uniref:Uroporphyrinogen decarboxylase, chloroplast n=1 Tax=Ectocarpus siliculosus TaxID=2880 RepID=D7FQS7_ECTSI|nr:Uroporphyrinogen decarboxylase, chloroplast precursor [Ectocarpus siliculosus]|eukprot:CBJ49184.1 Uroporphyrinogen decarboxylase, chloroplast precursor [Ectocarpus siliculosus]
MVYAKASIAYVAILLALGVSRSEAFVPSTAGAASLAKDSRRATAWSSARAGAAAVGLEQHCRRRRGAGCGRSRPCMSSSDEHDILLRVAKGEKAERAPVWLMRQAGRYMSAFRKYSDKYPFRHRSENPGDRDRGTGPVISNPIRTKADVEAVRVMEDIDGKLPFVGETLKALRSETEGKSTLIGFVGAPWTLAAYSIEGGSSKHALHTKKMMMEDPTLFHSLMTKLANSIGDYACYQVENGAQVIQVFESWAHQMIPSQFETFAKPYADLAMSILKQRHPDVPVIYFANGGSSYLESQRDTQADMISLDQFVNMRSARERLGASVPVSGNVDPLVLLGPTSGIKEAVRSCVRDAGSSGHILNLGHGVLQTTPESSVAALVDSAKEATYASVLDREEAPAPVA